MSPCNVLMVGATRMGKSKAAAHAALHFPGAVIIQDPHKQSLAQDVLTHATGNVLYARLSDLRHTIGFDLLRPSTKPNVHERRAENQLRAEAFVEILLRRRGSEGMGGAPLMEEWIMAAITLFLFQASPKPLRFLPFAFLPGTDEFRALLRDCVLPEISHKFTQLAELTPRGLRSETGSASRLINAVFNSPAFLAWSRGGFDFGAFLQDKGKLIVEKGDAIGDDPMRTIMGAINLLTIDHATSRPTPYPPIMVYLDECTNVGTAGKPELRAAAETSKAGLFWTFMVQNMDLPDEITQNCRRHEWFGCPRYELARKAATDILAGLSRSEQSRTERLAELTDEIVRLPPRRRYVRDEHGSRKEWVPLLNNGWPDWRGLRQMKLQEKLSCIYSRPEYREDDEPPFENGSPPETPPPPSSPESSSPVERLKRQGRKPTDGSAKPDDASA